MKQVFKRHALRILAGLCLAFPSIGFSADFSDTHTDGSLAGWTAEGGRSWSESTGQARPANNEGSAGFLINNTPPSSNGVLEIQMTADQWNGYRGGVVLRWNSPDSYYYIAVLPGNQWSSYISFCKNSMDATGGTRVAQNFVLNTTFTLKIEIEDDLFRFYIDDVYRGEITDDEIAGGKIGYAHSAEWNSYTSYDEITWTDAGSTTYSLNVATEGNGLVDPDSGVYEEGDSVIIFAAADSGWRFNHWSGDHEENENPTAIVMNQDMYITAHFVQDTHYVSMVAHVQGNGTVSPDSAVYLAGDSVHMNAYPDSGWSFLRWSGDYTGTDPNPSFVINQDMNITAHFVQDTHYVSLVAHVQGNGTVSPDSAVYLAGDSVHMNAYPDSGWSFLRWSGDYTGTDPSLSFVINHDMNITAHFVQDTHYVSLVTHIQGNGTVSPDSAVYLAGDSVHMNAYPDSGWSFQRWSGDYTGTDPNPSFVINQDMYITAHFVQDTHYVSLVAYVQGNGTVSPDSAVYLAGDTVHIYAYPDSGWSFDHWSGDFSGSTNPAVFVITSDMNITAHFVDSINIPNSQKIGITARLFDSDGTPLGNDLPITMDFTVTLFDNQNGGTLLYTETFHDLHGQAAIVNRGYFVVRLGEGTTSDNLRQVIDTNNNLWAEITVGETVLPERMPLTAAPYAIGN